MAKVKIHQITDISDYGASLNRFIESYLQSVEHVHRDFSIKTDSSEGAAISAFFQKLSQIQEQVFVQFPASLTRGSSSFIDYYDSLTGLGFDKEVWTSDDGKAVVVSKLTGEQYDKVSEVKDSLQAKLDVATDLLGIESVDLTPTMTGAENSLSSASDHRSKTHDGISTAYDTFLKTLSSTESELSAYVGILANAQFVTHVPVTSVLSAISSGSLRSDNMDQLDLIQNKTEATAYAAYLREDYATFFEQNPDEIKAELYDVVTVGMNEVLLSGDEKKVNAFLARLSHGLNAMIMGDYDYHMKHLAKLEASGERYSSVAFSSALLLHTNGKSETDAYNQLNRSLESNHHLRLLWRSLTVTGLRGQSLATNVEKPGVILGVPVIQRNKIGNLTYSQEYGLEFDIHWKRYKGIVDHTVATRYRLLEEINRSTNETRATFTMRKVPNEDLLSVLKEHEITELKLENKALPWKLTKDVLTSTASYANPLLGLAVLAFTELASGEGTSDYASFSGKTVPSGLATWSEIKDLPEGAAIAENMSSLFEHYGSYKENLEKIDQINDELFKNYLGYGGGVVETRTNTASNMTLAGYPDRLDPDVSVQSAEIDPYDIEAYTRYQQFESGIKGHMVSTDLEGNFATQWRLAKEKLSNTDNAGKIWSYIENGTQSGYSLDDFEYTDIKDVMDKLEEYNLVVDW